MAGNADSTAPWPATEGWLQYHDADLNALIERALRDAPSISSATARFESARESVRLAGTAGGLQVNGVASTQETRLSDNGIFPPKLLGFHWYNQSDLGFNFSYSFDWWGKQRANVESALDRAQASAADRQQAKLLLSGAVGQAYFGWQSDQARAKLARARIALWEQGEQLALKRVAAELDRPETIKDLRAQQAAEREGLISLESSARLRLVTLAALLGCSVSELPPLSFKELPEVTTGLPANVSLDLVARRPDIAASRWRVEASLQGLRVARAEYYPDITVSGLLALSSIHIEKLLEVGSLAPQLGAAVHLPLFDNGLRAANFSAQRSRLAEAVAVYNETVVSAAREVATAAQTRAQIDQQIIEREKQLTLAKDLLAAHEARLRASTADLRPVLAAARTVNLNQDALAQLAIAKVSADISLQGALGGGYQSNSEKEKP